MSTYRTVYCQHTECDRYRSPVTVYGHPDAELECPGLLAGRYPCGGALLTDGEWDAVNERLAERMLSDYHAGDAPQSTYDNAARRGDRGKQ